VASIEVRPFQRPDREQLKGLVNAHVGAVLPGVSVSVSAVMNQLERDPGEVVVDPWRWRDRRSWPSSATRSSPRRTSCDTERASGSATAIANAADVRWLVFWPRDEEAAVALAERLEAILVADVAACRAVAPRRSRASRCAASSAATRRASARSFLTALGWRELTRARRAWERRA